MRILLLADEECRALWDDFRRERLDGIDLILACGDLDPDYLSFLATFAVVPIVYVPGNHDGRYASHAPEGCLCADGRIVTCTCGGQKVRILGLGGCMRYNGGAHQYTEAQMRSRVRRLRPALHRLKGFDILLTHAPVQGLGDGEDAAHAGFAVFRDLIDRYHPVLAAHGHMHKNYSAHFRTERQFEWSDGSGSTRVVNGFERAVIEIEI